MLRGISMEVEKGRVYRDQRTYRFRKTTLLSILGTILSRILDLFAGWYGDDD